MRYSWANSRCLGSWLHRFSLKDQYLEGIVEECQICHKRLFFKVVEGRIDNMHYLAYHVRQALIPQHKLYQHEYQN